MIDDKTLRDGTVAAYRYLAFLDLELRNLRAELFPARGAADTYPVPADTQVLALVAGSSPFERIERVLGAVGIDPYEDDGWAATIGEASRL